MVILENIDIDIDKAILQNIDIDKISNRFKFGISNRASPRGPSKTRPKEMNINRLGYAVIRNYWGQNSLSAINIGSTCSSWEITPED